jgi:hypothetical protein
MNWGIYYNNIHINPGDIETRLKMIHIRLLKYNLNNIIIQNVVFVENLETFQKLKVLFKTTNKN